MTERPFIDRIDEIDPSLNDGDVRALMRESNRRDLETEGIPMFLGLVDERRAMPENTDAATIAEGTALRERLERYHRELVPFSLPDDEGALITSMKVLAFAHFEPPA